MASSLQYTLTKHQRAQYRDQPYLLLCSSPFAPSIQSSTPGRHPFRTFLRNSGNTNTTPIPSPHISTSRIHARIPRSKLRVTNPILCLDGRTTVTGNDIIELVAIGHNTHLCRRRGYHSSGGGFRGGSGCGGGRRRGSDSDTVVIAGD